MSVQQLVDVLDAYQPTREVVVEFCTRQGPVKIDRHASIVCNSGKIRIIVKKDINDSSGID